MDEKKEKNEAVMIILFLFKTDKKKGSPAREH
jgi:hypothetical protein